MLAETQFIYWYHLLQEALIPLAGCLVGIAAVIAVSWSRLERHRAEVELKRDMVARGMSAEEIERVLAAKSLRQQ